MEIKLEKKIISKLNKIFSDYPKTSKFKNLVDRGYLFSKIESKKVLFVGINPSFTKEAKSENGSFDPIVAVKKYPRFFKKFNDIAENCGFSNDWTYLDLLYLRETDQTQINEIVKSKQDLNFICDQLILSMDLIEEIQPKIIIVCNSSARKFFGKDVIIDKNIWMGYQFEFDNNCGVDVIKGINSESINEKVKQTKLINVPVLFTSSLTYVDISTKIRLLWQINLILKTLKIK